MTKDLYIQNRIREFGHVPIQNTTFKSNRDKCIAMECGDWPTFRGRTSFELTLKLLLECKYTERQIVDKLNIEFPENVNKTRPQLISSLFISDKCRNVTAYNKDGVIGLSWDRYKFFTETGEWAC